MQCQKTQLLKREFLSSKNSFDRGNERNACICESAMSQRTIVQLVSRMCHTTECSIQEKYQIWPFCATNDVVSNAAKKYRLQNVNLYSMNSIHWMSTERIWTLFQCIHMREVKIHRKEALKSKTYSYIYSVKLPLREERVCKRAHNSRQNQSRWNAPIGWSKRSSWKWTT